jgi:thiamine-phosphate pyrophosphorylase
MRGLYAIADVDALSRWAHDGRTLDPVRFAEAILAARPAALQLRDKHGGARRTLDLLGAIAPLAARAKIPFFANDRPDLALLARCDGVHVGQEDLPVALVRKVAPDLRAGLSTHNAAQVETALEEGPDYLALGPVFATSNKEQPSPVLGLDALAALAARVRAARPGLPVVAIGGVTLETAARVGAHADAVAVIGALLPEAGDDAAYDEVTARARALDEAIRGGGG